MKAKTHLSLPETARRSVSRHDAQERRRKPMHRKTHLARGKKQRLKRGLAAADSLAQQRVARVEALRAQVRNGTYQVDSSTLAEEIIAGLPYDLPGN